MDQRKRVTEARIAKQREIEARLEVMQIALSSSEAARAKRTRQNPRPSGNVRIVSYCYRTWFGSSIFLSHSFLSYLVQALQFARLKADCTGLSSACTAATIETWHLAVAIGEYVMDEIANSCSICVDHGHEEDIIEPRRRDQNVRRSKRDRYSAPVAEVMLNQKQELVENASEDFLDDMPQQYVQDPNIPAVGYDFSGTHFL